MSTEYVVGFAVLLFVLCFAAEPLARRLRLPHSAVLVVLGALVAYFVTLGLGIDTGEPRHLTLKGKAEVEVAHPVVSSLARPRTEHGAGGLFARQPIGHCA